jgi:hypothetical protein
MSIGNLKDSGNQGNNFPWQLKVLQGLQCICDEVKEINIDTDDLEQLLADLIAELEAGIDVTVVNGAGVAAVNIQDGGNSITVDGTVTANAGTGNFNVTQATASSLNATVVGGTGVSRTPNFLRPSTASPGTGIVAVGAFSASFASVGTANALVEGMVLKPGETLNFDAGAINNTLAAITYDVTTNAGAELIIITLT